MVLKQKDLAITSSSDWRKLELLTLFMIQHVKCEVTNYAKNTILLPTPSVRWDQDQVGKLPSDLAKKPELLISLADNHPVIDAIMVSHRSHHIYFIQTSFSAYANHKTKKADLFTKLIEGQTIFDHYTNHFSKYKSIYIYATPQSEHIVNDQEVFFLDLKRAVFRWT